MDDQSVFDNIVYLLDNEGVPYGVLEHEYVHTSEDAAKVRGTKIEEAAKALVLKDRQNDKIFMCVVSGHKRMDLKRVKEMVGSKNVSLATPEDVLAATGCKVGTVAPFPALFKLDGYCEAGVMENDHVVFSAGTHYKSIRMKAEDWKEIAGVVVERFAK